MVEVMVIFLVVDVDVVCWCALLSLSIHTRTVSGLNVSQKVRVRDVEIYCKRLLFVLIISAIVVWCLCLLSSLRSLI
jgi:hypothetical protein